MVTEAAESRRCAGKQVFDIDGKGQDSHQKGRSGIVCNLRISRSSLMQIRSGMWLKS